MSYSNKPAEAGYFYVLIHPSYPDLFKIGQTTRLPEERLAEHNSREDEYTGRVVKETGQKWELKTYVAVPDVVWAEASFWGATWQADIPFRRGIEIERMTWAEVQAGLATAQKAGVRPAPGPLNDWVYAYDAWMNNCLEGRGVKLLGHVRSKHGKSDFQCDNGHNWRSVPMKVAQGEGCPKCGTGARTLDEVRQMSKEGCLYLLTHPKQPGFIRIGLEYYAQGQTGQEPSWGDLQVHRYRHVDFPKVAERLIWELMGRPRPKEDEPIEIELKVAEQAIRDLAHAISREVALVEQARQMAIESSVLDI